ncbi:ATPase domain-containing protein [Halobacterium salinarum]|uniref:ATPase domain-containing protein n=1 Tax=Halobacterium salinarum TaxID=2242 RepID=UPI002553B0A4|nr:ATPase domain-containing protein [Halobacterium salinarum]MDL0128717.1 ATPase domain-containing protein [Halobacterium salinarum]MDL0137416.1 ATPase domain-containing protein [Halobacterium salinarum]MDL0140296.1 ATPase domain-containing protein [Halobacterium salinarum]
MGSESSTSRERVSTGVAGVNDVLGGGYLPDSATLVRGEPGSGKSIFSLHFLAAGIDAGETCLYINLGEPENYIRDTAQHFGFDIDSLAFLNLSASGDQFQGEQTYTLFESGEVETPSLVEDIRTEIQDIDPDRVVVDPVTEFRYLAPDEHQFRSQILGLINFLKSEGATVLLTSQAAESMPDDDLQFLVDAVVNMGNDSGRRTFHASKFRGSSVRSGHHTLQITDEGMRVWPRLDPNRHEREHTPTKLSSGVPALDSLLSGGLTSGTITFLSGPTGVGKTTTGLQFMKEAAGRGQRSVLYSFEEDRTTLFERASAVNIPLTEMIDRGTLNVEVIGPEALTVDEFTHHIRNEVEDNDAEIVMIDGTSGFEQSLRGTSENPMQDLVRIGRYLRNMGVTGIVSNEVHNITGELRATDQGMSYLADSIVVLRHVEYRGSLRKVIGVLKMRTSEYENQLRELEITEHGLRVGDSLPELRGILTGTPTWGDSGDDGD